MGKSVNTWFLRAGNTCTLSVQCTVADDHRPHSARPHIPPDLSSFSLIHLFDVGVGEGPHAGRSVGVALLRRRRRLLPLLLVGLLLAGGVAEASL